MKVKTVSHAKAMLAATKRLPFEREKKIEERLSYFCGSMAEAYKLGAEEAQSEIIRRLLILNVERPVHVTSNNTESSGEG